MAANRPTLSELTLLVRTPGNVHGYRSFTDAQRAEAELYASQQDVEVEPLP